MKVAGGEAQPTVSILEFRGDKVAREIVYITQRFDPSPDRKQWAELFEL